MEITFEKLKEAYESMKNITGDQLRIEIKECVVDYDKDGDVFHDDQIARIITKKLKDIVSDNANIVYNKAMIDIKAELAGMAQQVINQTTADGDEAAAILAEVQA